ncbi:HYR domain-containing protein, partial [Hyunsoonleella pacifica]
SLFPVGTTTNTFEVTDASGNTATCSFDVTVTDNENPTINCPAPINVNVDGGTDGAVVTYTAPVGTDNNASGTVTTTQIAGLPSGSLFPVGTTTNTFEVTDAAGNTATCSFDVTVTDNEDPTINCPAPINVNVDANECGTIVTYTTPVGIDNTTSAVTTQIAGLPSGSLFPIGTTTNTFEVTDASGNTTTCSFDVTVTDNEDPTITCPANVTANTSDDTTGNCTTTVSLGTPTTADNCSVASVVAQVNGADIDPASFEFPLGDTSVTWIVTDDSGNTANCTQTVTVIDDEDPTITCPEDITVNADPGLCSASNVDLGTPLTDDNCGVATVLNNTLEPFALGQTTVIWTVTDDSGNTATCEQIVTVVDGELPEIICPPAITINVDPGTCEATNVDLGNMDVQDCTDVIITNNAPSTFPLGNTIVTWTVTDLAGNSDTCEQTVTVEDNVPPTFVEALPTNITVECDNVPTEETLTATDNCSDAIVTFDEVRIDGSCTSNYILERTWTATDEAGLTTVHTQTITVEDTTPPSFVDRLPEDITVECDAIPAAEDISATDNCSSATVTTDDVIIEGSCVGTYTIERIYTATDECSLSVSYTQTINVEDTTAPAPVTTIEENITVSCTDIPEVPEIQFEDNCSTDIVEVFNEVNGFDDTVFEDYQIVRTWTVKDACNNEATYTQTLNVLLDEIITEINGPDRCFDDGTVDLNEFLTSENKEGTWELVEGNTQAELNGNIFDPTTLEPSLDFLPNNGDAITYVFRYTGLDAGCINITEVTMAINPDCVVLPCGDTDVVISKALTPNGDGFNDSFDIMGIELCGFTANVKIFNRWGALIYESSNYTLGEAQGSWQGSAHKSSVGSAGKVPNGTYYYIINLENSGLPPYTGPIYIGTK